MVRLCPACFYRTEQVVDPDCVICQGQGVMRLGEAAVSTYSIETVSGAVGLALEASARGGASSRYLSEDRLSGIRDTLIMLQDAGILSNEDGLSESLAPAVVASRTKSATPASVASYAVQEPIEEIDEELRHAEHHVYDEHARPLAEGLPTVSKSGHPSCLARLTDPANPLGDTQKDRIRRYGREYRKKVLVGAAKSAARQREPRKITAETLEMVIPGLEKV